MTPARARDLGGSKQSLRDAIGRLDEPEAAAPRRAPAAEPAPARRLPARVWIVALTLGLLAAGAAAAVLIT